MVPSKRTSFLPAADVKPLSNDLAHAMHCQCMFALSMFMLRSLCIKCFSSSLTKKINKLERLSVASISIVVSTGVEHLIGTDLSRKY